MKELRPEGPGAARGQRNLCLDTAKDTVGKEYGDIAANIGPISEKTFHQYNF